MSEDLTKKLPSSDSDKIALILTTVQNLDTRVSNIEQRFDVLEKKVDERLHDTRPIWEKVVADVAQLQEGQRRLEELTSSGLREIKTSVRDINRRMTIMNDTLLAMQADYRDIDNRVHELELQQQKPTNSST